MKNRYEEAALRIPRGQTRAFMELAAMAGRPGAARAAGRAIRACGERSRVPWHRVVASDGSLAKDAERGRLQLARLRREGARPRAREAVRAWIERSGFRWVASYVLRRFARADDERVDGWPAARVEALASDVDGLSRGFLHLDAEAASSPVPRPRRSGRTPRGRGTPPLEQRLDAIDWPGARAELAARGLFHLPALLSPGECDAVLGAAAGANPFERTIEMAPRGFGVGTYHYWREPLPEPAHTLRERLYARLGPAASDFRPCASRPHPPTLAGFWRHCRSAGQRRPSSIFLRYGAGGVNHPHRDVYGDECFPFQAVVCLSRRGRDFDGGELFLAEERPGAEDRVTEVAVSEGDVVVFSVRERLDDSTGRRRRVALRHGMRQVLRGERFALGLVFHLAR